MAPSAKPLAWPFGADWPCYESSRPWRIWGLRPLVTRRTDAGGRGLREGGGHRLGFRRRVRERKPVPAATVGSGATPFRTAPVNRRMARSSELRCPARIRPGSTRPGTTSRRRRCPCRKGHAGRRRWRLAKGDGDGESRSWTCGRQSASITAETLNGLPLSAPRAVSIIPEHNRVPWARRGGSQQDNMYRSTAQTSPTRFGGLGTEVNSYIAEVNLKSAESPFGHTSSAVISAVGPANEFFFRHQPIAGCRGSSAPISPAIC